MKRYVPQMLLAAICIAGAMVTMVGCDDQGQASDNLLTNPGAMKYAANNVRAFFTPRDISDEATPIREMNNLNQDPIKDTAVVRGQWFHEKVPEHTKTFWMVHDGSFTNYVDGSGVTWYHVVSGPWASYYSPNPNGPPDGEEFHDVRGPTETTLTDMWHISWGPDATKYYDPTGGGSVWEHIPSGFDASRYKPVGSQHIESGPNQSLYAVPVPSDTLGDGTL